jgi:hypothetical protein
LNLWQSMHLVLFLQAFSALVCSTTGTAGGFQGETFRSVRGRIG